MPGLRLPVIEMMDFYYPLACYPCDKYFAHLWYHPGFGMKKPSFTDKKALSVPENPTMVMTVR